MLIRRFSYYVHMADKTPADIDEYISTFPDDVQPILEKVRQTLRKALPETTEGISYGMPVFNLNGHYLVYFAGWKHHISLYPVPYGDPEFQKEIKPFLSGQGTLKFPLDKPIPYDLIEKVALLHLKNK